VALPELSAEVPNVVAPSKKVTVPVGVFDPEAGVTVAVKITDCPKTDGLTEEVTALVVFILFAVATVKLAMAVAQLPALLLLMNSFSDQNVVPVTGSTPVPL